MRDRFRQRNEVFLCTPQRRAAARTVSPSMRAWAYSGQHARYLNRASGVLVRGLKVLPQAAQRKLRQATGTAPAPTRSMTTVRAGRVGSENFRERTRRWSLVAQPLDRSLTLHRRQFLGLQQPATERFGKHEGYPHISHTHHKDSCFQQLTQTEPSSSTALSTPATNLVLCSLIALGSPGRVTLRGSLPEVDPTAAAPRDRARPA